MASGKTTPGWPRWRRIRNEPCVSGNCSDRARRGQRNQESGTSRKADLPWGHDSGFDYVKNPELIACSRGRFPFNQRSSSKSFAWEPCCAQSGHADWRCWGGLHACVRLPVLGGQQQIWTIRAWNGVNSSKYQNWLPDLLLFTALSAHDCRLYCFFSADRPLVACARLQGQLHPNTLRSERVQRVLMVSGPLRVLPVRGVGALSTEPDQAMLGSNCSSLCTCIIYVYIYIYIYICIHVRIQTKHIYIYIYI